MLISLLANRLTGILVNLCVLYLCMVLGIYEREPRLRRLSHWKALLSWMSQPVTPIPDNKPFYIVWNSPSFRCGRRFGLPMDLYKFGIISNEFELFHGEAINIFYESRLGLYPRYLPNGEPKYGGIPQLANLTAHLEWVRRDIEWYIPNITYNGLAVIDWESWRPLFSRNWQQKRIYQKASIDLVLKHHPWWSPQNVVPEAKRQFEIAAKEFMKKTLSLCRELRPRAKWGFYLFPDCYNYKPGEERCKRRVIEGNDRLFWLFTESSALYPSIYLSDKFTTPEQRLHVRGILNEAFRVRTRVTHPSIPVIPYTRYVFSDSGKFYDKAALQNTIGEAVDSGAAGVSIWESSANLQNEEQCTQLHAYVQNILGPYVKDLLGWTENCSVSLCNGHGRCVTPYYQSNIGFSGGTVTIRKGPSINRIKVHKEKPKGTPRPRTTLEKATGKLATGPLSTRESIVFKVTRDNGNSSDPNILNSTTTRISGPNSRSQILNEFRPSKNRGHASTNRVQLSTPIETTANWHQYISKTPLLGYPETRFNSSKAIVPDIFTEVRQSEDTGSVESTSHQTRNRNFPIDTKTPVSYPTTKLISNNYATSLSVNNIQNTKLLSPPIFNPVVKVTGSTSTTSPILSTQQMVTSTEQQGARELLFHTLSYRNTQSPAPPQNKQIVDISQPAPIQSTSTQTVMKSTPSTKPSPQRQETSTRPLQISTQSSTYLPKITVHSSPQSSETSTQISTQPSIQNLQTSTETSQTLTRISTRIKESQHSSTTGLHTSRPPLQILTESNSKSSQTNSKQLITPQTTNSSYETQEKSRVPFNATDNSSIELTTDHPSVETITVDSKPSTEWTLLNTFVRLLIIVYVRFRGVFITNESFENTRSDSTASVMKLKWSEHGAQTSEYLVYKHAANVDLKVKVKGYDSGKSNHNVNYRLKKRDARIGKSSIRVNNDIGLYLPKPDVVINIAGKPEKSLKTEHILKPEVNQYPHNRSRHDKSGYDLNETKDRHMHRGSNQHQQTHSQDRHLANNYDNYICRCYPGWTGKYCDIKT